MNLEFLTRPQLEARVRAAENFAAVRFTAGLVLGMLIGAGLAGTAVAIGYMVGGS
jgi:hypothetical protein